MKFVVEVFFLDTGESVDWLLFEASRRFEVAVGRSRM